VITCYNYGKYLSEAIKSAINQTYENIEIIVVDDGSTDNTKEVAHKFKDDIAYYYQKNSGVASARNNGAKKSKGQYLVFLDADDILSDNYVEICIDKIEDDSSKYIYTDMNLFGSESRAHEAFDFDPYYLVNKGNYIHVGALIEKDAFIKVGGFSNLEAFEDWDLWLKFLDQGMRGAYTKDAIYNYRRHEGSRDDISDRKKARIIRQILSRHPESKKQFYKKESSIIKLLRKINGN
jgi:glycosyltransferase involved in cell wall biosynthesis